MVAYFLYGIKASKDQCLNLFLKFSCNFTPFFCHLHAFRCYCQTHHDNFLLWKAQLIPYFRGQDLFGYIDGSIFKPPKIISITHPETSVVSERLNPAYSQWVRQDNLILSTLMTSLSEPILAQVVTYTSSKTVWNALDDTFSSRSRAHILQIHTQLAIAIKGSKTTTNYFHYIKRLTNELAVAGQPLNHDDIITYILAGLDHEYDSFMASISARTDDITLEEIYLYYWLLKLACQGINSPLSSSNLLPILHIDTTTLQGVVVFVTGGVLIMVVIVTETRIMINHLLFARYVVRLDTLQRNAIFILICLTRKHLLYQQNMAWSLYVTLPTIRGTLHGMQIQEPYIILPMMLIIWLFKNPTMMV